MLVYFWSFLYIRCSLPLLFCVCQNLNSQHSLSAVSQSDSASSTQSLTHGGVPELLVGLSYNATTGRMSVEVIKGSHFRNLALNRPPGLHCTHIKIFELRQCFSVSSQFSQ